MPLHLELGALETVSTPLTPAHAASRKSLHALSLVVAKSKRAVVITGAGISCSSGIPDFRSSDGLYNLVKSRYPNVVMKGRDLFSASLFRESESTRLFYSFIAELKLSVDKARPAPTHHFIKTLDTKGKLLRSYTQNIDGLEDRVNLPSSTSSGKGKGKAINIKEIRNVQLHGDIHRVRCVMCNASYPCTEDYLSTFLRGAPPPCPDCSTRSKLRIARNARALAVGTLRPSIVLYDEVHPLGDEIGTISTRDIGRKPDLLIIMGTSLKVHGIKRLVKDFANAVHATPMNAKDKDAIPNTSQTTLPASPSQPSRPSIIIHKGKSPRLVVFVNRTPPPADLAPIIDVWVEGDTDTWCTKVEADWRRARPQDWEVQSLLSPALLNKEKEGGSKENQHWQVVKDCASTVKGKVSGKMPLSGSENLYPNLGPSGSKPISPSSPTRHISAIPRSSLASVKNAVMASSLPPILPSKPVSKVKAAKTRRPISPSRVPLPTSPQKRRPPTSTNGIDLTGDEDECEGDIDPLSVQHPRKRQAVAQRPSIDKLEFGAPNKRSDNAEMGLDADDPFVNPPSSQISDTGTLCMPLSQMSEATLVEDEPSSQRNSKASRRGTRKGSSAKEPVLSFPVVKPATKSSAKTTGKGSRSQSRKPRATTGTAQI